MRYYGGKNQDGVYHKIINQIPPHARYIEPFLGGGAIMRRKRPAILENIGIEIDTEAIRYFKSVMKDGSRIPNLKIINGDALNRLLLMSEVHWQLGSETFIYCDPPYLKGTRSDQRDRYRFEMTDADHFRLLSLIKGLNCPVMISTYPNEMYSEELAEWRTVEFKSVKSNGAPATEQLFMNYQEPVFLHDYRYIGTDSQNRQDINRRIRRTVKRILGWPKHERAKLFMQFIREMPEDERNLFRYRTGKSAGPPGAITPVLDPATETNPK